MKPTLRRKLEALAERHEELERLLSDPKIASDNRQIPLLLPRIRRNSHRSRPSPRSRRNPQTKADPAAAETTSATDPEMRELAEQEIAVAQAIPDHT